MILILTTLRFIQTCGLCNRDWPEVWGLKSHHPIECRPPDHDHWSFGWQKMIQWVVTPFGEYKRKRGKEDQSHLHHNTFQIYCYWYSSQTGLKVPRHMVGVNSSVFCLSQAQTLDASALACMPGRGVRQRVPFLPCWVITLDLVFHPDLSLSWVAAATWALAPFWGSWDAAATVARRSQRQMGERVRIRWNQCLSLS